jgi:hypothetical protein
MARRQSDIACDLLAIAKWPKKYFAYQYGGKLSANAPELTNFWILSALVCVDAFADAMASHSVSIALII